MQITLNEQQEKFITTQLASGNFSHPEEVVTTAFKLLEKLQAEYSNPKSDRDTSKPISLWERACPQMKSDRYIPVDPFSPTRTGVTAHPEECAYVEIIANNIVRATHK
jgi:Arc/MetJ-type ribon-helix-helix transcriptional regulator